MRRGSGLLLGALLAATPTPPAGWQRIAAPLAVTLPADLGSHPAFQTEWWYATGTLRDEGGARFGFELTFFRRGLDPSPPAPGSSELRARHVLAAHLAIADVGERRVRFAQRVRRAAGGLAGAAVGALDVFVEDWEMRRLADGRLALDASDAETGLALSLELEPEKKAVLEGEGGISRKGVAPGNASAYVSFTRLAARGRVALDGHVHAVRGEAWFDHEWGTSQLGAGIAGWDWFGLRLIDGRELMVYRLRRGDGGAAPESSATLVGRDGSARHLAAAEFSLAELAWWRSPRTAARYPVAFRITVPGAGIDVEVRALVADAELDARATTGIVYWEGPVAVRGSPTGGGYAELVGYAGPLAGLF